MLLAEEFCLGGLLKMSNLISHKPFLNFCCICGSPANETTGMCSHLCANAPEQIVAPTSTLVPSFELNSSSENDLMSMHHSAFSQNASNAYSNEINTSIDALIMQFLVQIAESERMEALIHKIKKTNLTNFKIYGAEGC